jgi:hypothetical protein
MKYLGFVLLVLSGYVMAEEVYYCSDNTGMATGFKKKDGQTGQYERSGFNESKFKMKLQDDGNIAIAEPGLSSGRRLYICSTPYEGRQNMEKNKSCVEEYHSGYHFNFNQDNGRYILFQGSGYTFSKDDSVIARIGTCTKF